MIGMSLISCMVSNLKSTPFPKSYSLDCNCYINAYYVTSDRPYLFWDIRSGFELMHLNLNLFFKADFLQPHSSTDF